MEVVWRDAEEPIEYRSTRASVGYFVELLYPIAAFLITCAFVVMSYYIAPSSLVVEEKPVMEVPKYYYINSNMQDTTGVKKYSYLGCNFPAFQNKELITYHDPPSFSASVDPYNRATVTIEIPQADDLIFSQIIIPISFRFSKLGKPTGCSYISLSLPGKKRTKIDVYGSLDIRQTGDLKATSNSLTDILSQVKAAENGLFSMNKIFAAFKTSPLHTSFVQTRIEYGNNPVTGTNKLITIHFTVPSMIVAEEAPFWNVFRNTYVQLFYWLWVTIALLYPFVDAAFTYGVIHSSEHRLLKSNPKFKSD